MLPNFLCIGAQKCGTTTLWHLLDGHPDVFMARPRETRFFHDDLLFEEGAARYEIDFFGGWAGQRAVGEKCPEYLFDPRAPERILATLGPTTRLIVALRSPARRAHSHYRHNLAMLRENRPFAQALEAEQEGGAAGRTVPAAFAYLGRGLYARQLRRYLDRFGAAQVLVVHFETEITGNQAALADRLADFLGVARASPRLPIRSGRPPLEGMRIRARPAAVEISRPRPRPRGLRALLPPRSEERCIRNPSPGLVEFANRWNAQQETLQPMSGDEELQMNRRFFADDIQELRALVGFDVSPWLG